ncbi:hypothetical protein SprV_1002800600 [Sparganum proliferum]
MHNVAGEGPTLWGSSVVTVTQGPSPPLRYVTSREPGVKDRLTNLRLPHRGSQFAKISSVYAPTMIGSDEATKFYKDLLVLMESVTEAVCSLLTPRLRINFL